MLMEMDLFEINFEIKLYWWNSRVHALAHYWWARCSGQEKEKGTEFSYGQKWPTNYA